MSENKINIIAEAAQGYEGNFNLSKKFITESKKSEATSIKFQLVFADELATKNYQDYEIFKKIEMKPSQWIYLRKLALKKKISFILDIFGDLSLSLAKKMNVDGIKIHPTDLNNTQFLKKISKKKFKKIFLGVGGGTLTEIKRALKILPKKKTVIMFGFQSYPTPTKTNQIIRIAKILKILKNGEYELGFADHSIPNTLSEYVPSILAIGAGCLHIEKHLTLPYHRKLEDWESAYKPKEFKKYVKLLNISNGAMGKIDYKKNDFSMSLNEKNYLKKVRRKIILNRELNKNTKIKIKYIDLKRSPDESALTNIKDILGKRLKKNISKNTPLRKEHII
tara:strand:- start:108 stop:1115 length:1008 start_codon:yes stop_codon:yes gene_type:complete